MAETTTADTLFIKSGGDIKQISMANLLTQIYPDIELAALKKQMPIGYTFAWNQTSGSGIDLSTAEKVAEYYGFGTWEQIEKTYYSEFKQFKDMVTIRNANNVVINVRSFARIRVYLLLATLYVRTCKGWICERSKLNDPDDLV